MSRRRGVTWWSATGGGNLRCQRQGQQSRHSGIFSFRCCKPGVSQNCCRTICRLLTVCLQSDASVNANAKASSFIPFVPSQLSHAGSKTSFARRLLWCLVSDVQCWAWLGRTRVTQMMARRPDAAQVQRPAGVRVWRLARTATFPLSVPHHWLTFAAAFVMTQFVPAVL